MKKALFIPVILFSVILLSSCSNSSPEASTITPLSAVTTTASISTSNVSATATGQNTSLPADALNRTPIAFELKDVNGNTVSSSSLNGKPTVINFFATWCGYCENEMPYFTQLESKYGDKINMIYIDTLDDASASDLKAFFSDMDMDYTNVLIDKGSSLLNSYSYSAVPVTIIMDANGIIRKIRVGAFTSYQTLENYVVNYGQLK